MLRRRLLERVLDADLDPSAQRNGRPEDIQTSILESLRRIFNSGQGDASTDPLYGLPDVRGVVRNLPEASEDMRQAILHAVERYEPRLRRVKVIEISDPGSRFLRFDIVAELNDGSPPGTDRVKFATRLDTSGRLAVEG